MSDDNISKLQTRGRKAIEAARSEVESEDMSKAVTKLKVKLRELKDAETIVGNIKREIADLEQSITQGND